MLRRFLVLAFLFSFAAVTVALAAEAPKEKPTQTAPVSKPATEEPPVTIVSAVIDTVHNHNSPGTTLILNGKLVYQDFYGEPVVNVTIRSHQGVAGLSFKAKWFDKSGKDITKDTTKHRPTDTDVGFSSHCAMSTESKDEITFRLMFKDFPRNNTIEIMKCSIVSLYFRDKGWMDLKTPIAFEAKKQTSLHK